MTTSLPTADELADVLGLRSGGAGAVTEHDRFNMIMLYMLPRLYVNVPLEKRTVVLSRFAAKYLPQLIDKILNPDLPADREYEGTISNAYTRMLHTLETNPYFCKFILTDTPAADKSVQLAHYLAQELIAQATSFLLMAQRSQDQSLT